MVSDGTSNVTCGCDTEPADMGPADMGPDDKGPDKDTGQGIDGDSINETVKAIRTFVTNPDQLRFVST